MKYFLSLVVVALALSASAQDSTKNFKPSKGDLNTEVNFKPFGSNPISLSYLRFRTFLDDNIALRIGSLYTVSNEKPNDDTESKTNFINVRPGIEFHYLGSSRLSPYFGFEFDIALRRSEFKTVNNFTSQPIEIENASDFNGSNRAFNRIGFNLIVGADFYIAPKVYLGTEFGYGYQQTNFKNVIEREGGSIQSESNKARSIEFGLNFNSAIRLGYIF